MPMQAPVRVKVVGEMPPPKVDWDEALIGWVSLSTRLIIFRDPHVPIEPLFAEHWPEEMPRVIDDGISMLVVGGTISVVRALLHGDRGFEARIVRV